MKENIQKIYSTDEVLKVLGVSKATLHRMVKNRLFPAPCKVSGKRKNGWLDGTLREWQTRLVKGAEVAE